MAQQTAPSSQKDKPIGFVLDDGGNLYVHTLAIRPEDLVRTEPSRLVAHQTLDGDGWADNFGPGLSQVTIAGTTGWRPNQLDGLDWKASFDKLYSTVFSRWHSARAERVALGEDPSVVKLVMVDTLNGHTSIVAPISFQLKRSKSRPLLMQYNISLMVLKKSAGDYGRHLKTRPNVADKKLGLDSMSNSIDSLNAKISGVSSWMDATLVAPMRSFMEMTASIMTKVRDTQAEIGKVTGALAAAAILITSAGANIFHTLGMIAGLPQLVRAQYMALAGVFTNFRCLMQNAFDAGRAVPDYSAFYGASICSSTTGGSPLMPYSTTSSLESLASSSLASSASISVSPSASTALTTLSNNDPVVTPLPTATIATYASDIAAGVTF